MLKRIVGCVFEFSRKQQKKRKTETKLTRGQKNSKLMFDILVIRDRKREKQRQKLTLC